MSSLTFSGYEYRMLRFMFADLIIVQLVTRYLYGLLMRPELRSEFPAVFAISNRRRLSADW